MSARKEQGNTLWIAIVAALVLVGLAVFGALHLRLPGPASPQPPKTATTGGVAVARIEADSALLQKVELFDPRPLFLPTAINNSDPALPARFRREPGSSFRPMPPRLAFAEYEMKVALPEPIEVPKDPIQAIHVGTSPGPFFAFGRINYPYTPLSPRLAYLEVLQARTGRVVLAAPLDAAPQDKFPAVDWQPIEMVVAVQPAGVIVEPTVTSGSGYAEVDSYFRDVIANRFRLGARLAPGFYMLRVGP